MIRNRQPTDGPGAPAEEPSVAVEPGDGRPSATESLYSLRVALDILPDAVFFVDRLTMRFVDANHAAARTLGYPADALLTMGPSQIRLGTTDETLAAEFDAVIRGTAGSGLVQTWHRRSDGSQFPVEWRFRAAPVDGRHVVIVVARETSAGAHADGSHDPLTGLPDRRLFDRRLADAVARGKSDPGYVFGVLYVDLDRFKQINDSLGHSAGDLVLGDVAARLTRCIRPGDMVSRRGGDEFTVLVDHLSKANDAAEVAERIQLQLKPPVRWNGHSVPVSASIGIALGPGSYLRGADLLDDADRAMYLAKRGGRARHVLFTPPARPR